MNIHRVMTGIKKYIYHKPLVEMWSGIKEKRNPVKVVDKLMNFPVNLQSNLTLISTWQNNWELLLKSCQPFTLHQLSTVILRTML